MYVQEIYQHTYIWQRVKKPADADHAACMADRRPKEERRARKWVSSVIYKYFEIEKSEERVENLVMFCTLKAALKSAD